tara:strand:- start:236 stop:1108 length:873 start_codon:yes stop_codon:yes gene_type:complete
MSQKPASQRSRGIPTRLELEAFNEFILPHLPDRPKFGPPPKLCDYKMFNYILKFLYIGCQWAELPIATNETGTPEIHYTRVYNRFRLWEKQGVFDLIFEGTVFQLAQTELLDTSVLHGDGTTTAAKKGGDNLGYNGHKHMKGDKVVAICDRNCNIIAPFITAPGNRNECPLLPEAMRSLKQIAKAVKISLGGSIMSLDGVYDSRANRKLIFNSGMTPNIPENHRNRKSKKRGRNRLFDSKIFNERFYTIERVFAWEDKFRRLVLRYERLSHLHYALKTLAYSMINLRHFC